MNYPAACRGELKPAVFTPSFQAIR